MPELTTSVKVRTLNVLIPDVRAIDSSVSDVFGS